MKSQIFHYIEEVIFGNFYLFDFVSYKYFY